MKTCMAHNPHSATLWKCAACGRLYQAVTPAIKRCACGARLCRLERGKA